MKVSLYSQFDPAWSSEVMKPSSETMGRFGCLVTCVSMSLTNYAMDRDPGSLCNLLGTVNGFDAHANLLHEAVEKVNPNLCFFERTYTSNSPSNSQKMLIGAAMQRVNKLLKYGQPVPLEVDNVGGDGRPDHWVLAVEEKNGDYLIHNPDGGVKQWFSARYGDPAKKLYGYYAVIGPPIDDTSGIGTALWKAAMVAKGVNVQTYAKEIVKDLL